MTALQRAVGSGDHTDGPPDAPAVLVEYGDYECPYCGEVYPQVKRLKRALGDRLLFVYRHFPLSRMHPYALQAAEAAEAAAEQGRFWEMHHLLFTNQEDLSVPALHALADHLGLARARFDAALESHRFLKRVRLDLLDGARSGVNGTPSFFLDGYRYDGPRTSEAFLEAITGESAAFPG